MPWEVCELATDEAHLATSLLVQQGAPAQSAEHLAVLLDSPLTVCVAALEQGEVRAALLATRVPSFSGGEMLCIDAFLVRQMALAQSLLSALSERARRWGCEVLFLPCPPADLSYLIRSLGAVQANGAWVWWVAPRPTPG